MKTKVVSLIGMSAIVALSFAFSPAAKAKVEKKAAKEMGKDKEPIGGLVSEDKF